MSEHHPPAPTPAPATERSIQQPVHRSARALTSLDDALAHILAAVQPLPAEDCPLHDADGRVLAVDCISALNVPPLDNSAMDGYAVRLADLSGPAPWTLPVTQRIAAGQVGTDLEPGTAARIFTGAPLPAGADAVIMQEQCDIVAQDTLTAPKFSHCPHVRINAPAPTAGQWVRRAGQDIAQGSVALHAGTRLNPASVGLAASLGLAQLRAHRRVRVALFSTGDELVEPGTVAPAALPAGHIFNSNRAMLAAILRRLGCQVRDGGILPDALDATTQAIAQAVEQGCDLIVTSAGASVGEADHVSAAIAQLGTLEVHQLAIKPGKPLAWGRIPAPTATAGLLRPTSPKVDLGRGQPHQPDIHFLGLPGNPAASLVTALLIVRPVVLALQGMRDVQPRAIAARADFDWPRADARREFLRARLNAQGHLTLFANQNSGVLSSAVWADGLIDCPPNSPIRAGDVVRFLPFSQLWES